MDPDTARALLTEGLDLLDGLPEYDESQVLALGTRLRADGRDPALVAAVLSQSRLRARAVDKFGADAARMLFTPDGLEQATRRDVADHHAARFSNVYVPLVHDLGCGVGADALALNRTGMTTLAVDADEATALLAHHNLRTLHPDTSSAASCARAEDVHPGRGDGVWFDPARRTPGRTDAAGRTRRTFRLEDMSPSWNVVLDMAMRVQAVGAKLSPAFPHAEIPTGVEAEWVSTNGALVECALWWGPLTERPGRTATLLRPDTTPLRLGEVDAEGAPPPGDVAVSDGTYLYEPDLAVLQSGLVGALAHATEGAEIAPGMGYVASDLNTDVPFARRHRVVEILPATVKAIKTWLRHEGFSRITVKRRGGRLTAEELRARLGSAVREGDEATLLLTVGPDGPVALVLGP